MMGGSHALTGAATGVWAPAVAIPFGAPHLSPVERVVFAAAVMAWAVWPDIDHARTSTAKGMWGPVSAIPATVVGWIAGGHRGATHHALAAAVAGVAVWWSGGHPAALGLVYAVTTGMFLAGLGAVNRHWRVSPGWNLVASTATALILVGAGVSWPWLPYAAGLGVAVHIAGDKVKIGSVLEGVVRGVSILALLAWAVLAVTAVTN